MVVSYLDICCSSTEAARAFCTGLETPISYMAAVMGPIPAKLTLRLHWVVLMVRAALTTVKMAL